MHYRKLRACRLPVLFELRLNFALLRLGSALSADLKPDVKPHLKPGPGAGELASQLALMLATKNVIGLPYAHLRPRIRDYVESMLLVSNMSPSLGNIFRLVEKFAPLVSLSDSGKPFIYKKQNVIALLFDVSAVQSEMHLDAPDTLILGYTQAIMGFLLFNPDPKNIGMIGLGGGSLPKYCYRYLPYAAIVVAENDPDVIALRDQFRVPKNNPRFEVRCEDGAELVRDSSGRFDILIVDGFDREGQPAQLCSQKFYDDCFRALAENGIMVVNLLGDVLDTQVCLDRIRLSFDGAPIVIDDRESLNKIVFACKGDRLNAPAHLLRARLRKLEPLHPVMLSPAMQSLLQQRGSDEVSDHEPDACARLRA